MADYSTRWKAEIVLEYTIPFGSHVAEIGKALASMEREVAQHSGGDIFIEHDDEHLIFRSVISGSTYPQKPNFQVARGGVHTVPAPGHTSEPLLREAGPS